MEPRSHIPVSLPHPHPTASYWHHTPSPLANHRTTPTLPPTANYLIIGSGISGASIALNILERQPGAEVLMLEARTACGGATGRNGGHTKGASYRHFPADLTTHGPAEATRIARLERSTVLATRALVRRHHIPCDLQACRTVDLIYDAAQLASATKTVDWMNARIDGEVERYTLVPQEEARTRFQCPEALGAIEYEAGSVHSYKLGTGVLEVCVKLGLNLQTGTAVTGVERGDADWVVKTPRADVRAGNVVLATNGYTAHLLPEVFQTLIVPLRGQVTAQRPGRALAPLEHTYTFAYEEGYEYMIPRPAGTADAGTIVIGGGWATLPDGGASEFGVTDDSVLNPDVSEYLYECTARYFGSNWGEDAKQGRTKAEWTGIMGTTSDGTPFVGGVPGMKGVWCSAGFNGHGMVLCLKSAEALVTEMLGNEGEKKKLDEWFPRSFRLTEERLGRLKKRKFEGRRNVAPPVEIVDIA